jgi:hypothetical protein
MGLFSVHWRRREDSFHAPGLDHCCLDSTSAAASLLPPRHRGLRSHRAPDMPRVPRGRSAARLRLFRPRINFCSRRRGVGTVKGRLRFFEQPAHFSTARHTTQDDEEVSRLLPDARMTFITAQRANVFPRRGHSGIARRFTRFQTGQFGRHGIGAADIPVDSEASAVSGVVVARLWGRREPRPQPSCDGGPRQQWHACIAGDGSRSRPEAGIAFAWRDDSEFVRPTAHVREPTRLKQSNKQNNENE